MQWRNQAKTHCDYQQGFAYNAAPADRKLEDTLRKRIGRKLTSTTSEVHRHPTHDYFARACLVRHRQWHDKHLPLRRSRVLCFSSLRRRLYRSGGVRIGGLGNRLVSGTDAARHRAHRFGPGNSVCNAAGCDASTSCRGGLVHCLAWHQALVASSHQSAVRLYSFLRSDLSSSLVDIQPRNDRRSGWDLHRRDEQLRRSPIPLLRFIALHMEQLPKTPFMPACAFILLTDFVS